MVARVGDADLGFPTVITGQRPWNPFLLWEAMRDRTREIVRGRVDKMGFRAPVTVHRNGNNAEVVLRGFRVAQLELRAGLHNL